MGKEMIKQCGRLPLAVVVLGGILSSKPTYHDWKIVRNNIQSYLVRHGQKDVQAILAMSYDDLPVHLKPCFLYLSKYAEDAEIEVDTLYQYWMAEGMVSSELRMENETMMDVAEYYLNELVERCMVFVENNEMDSYNPSFTRFKSCRLHDLMRDLCISKAKEEKFLEYGKVNDDVEASSTSARSICRLSISLAEKDDVKRFVPSAKAMRRSLRSFTLDLQNGYAGEKPNTSDFNFSEFVMLRVLSLKGVGNDSTSASGGVCGVVYHKKIDPLSIGKLVHLRYLSLRENRFLITAASISKLKQLQTLDLRHQRIVWMSNVVWKLPRLNHLYLPDMKPSDLEKKLGLDGLPKLEILEGFNNKVCNVTHLSELANLRKLEASVTDKLEDLEELINHVKNLTHLRCMRLSISISDLSSGKAVAIMNDVLSCSSLVTIWIMGKLSKLPEYIGANLRSLYLFYCSVEEDPLSTLERLPNLRTLFLSYNSFVGKKMHCCASGFPQLRMLFLHGLLNLEKWEIEDGAMPNLSQLRIDDCSKLEMIPAELRCEAFYIVDMPEEFKKRFRVNEDGEEGPDFHKLPHVQTITIV